VSDELADALRELAAQHETPPRVEAAEIRDRARRRSRRRRASVALGTTATALCVVTAAAFTLHTEDLDRHGHLPGKASGTASDSAAPSMAPPSMAPPSRATRVPDPAPSGRLDLGLHTLTVRDRVLRIDAHSFGRFPDGTRLTVVAKADTAVLRLRDEPKLEEVKVPYMVELRTPDGGPVYAGALAYDTGALRKLSDGTGWLDMNTRDAQWFYAQVREGDRIELTSTSTPPAGTTTDAGEGGPRAAVPDPNPTVRVPEDAGTAAAAPLEAHRAR